MTTIRTVRNVCGVLARSGGAIMPLRMRGEMMYQYVK